MNWLIPKMFRCWVRQFVLPCLISRVMQLGALVSILSSQHSKRHSLEGVMNWYLQCSLTKVNHPSKYLTVPILLKNLHRWVLHSYSECSHLWNFRAHIARWCAEISHPHRIIKDHQFDILIKAGHPGTSLTQAFIAWTVHLHHSRDLGILTWYHEGAKGNMSAWIWYSKELIGLVYLVSHQQSTCTRIPQNIGWAWTWK